MNNFNKCPHCGFENDLYTSECLECFKELNLYSSVELKETKKSYDTSKKIEESLDLIVEEVSKSFQFLSNNANLKIGYTTDLEIMEVISKLEFSNLNFINLEQQIKCNLILDHLFHKRKLQVRNFTLIRYVQLFKIMSGDLSNLGRKEAHLEFFSLVFLNHNYRLSYR